MPKIRDRELDPINCTTCGKDVAWTAPGEAKRITVRAAVYCEECKDGPATLTPRQEEVISVAEGLAKEIGKAPTFAEIGDAMRPPLTRSRVQSLVASIRLRGHADAFTDALYGAEPIPATPVGAGAEDVPLEPWERDLLVPAPPAEVDAGTAHAVAVATGVLPVTDVPSTPLGDEKFGTKPSWGDVKY